MMTDKHFEATQRHLGVGRQEAPEYVRARAKLVDEPDPEHWVIACSAEVGTCAEFLKIGKCFLPRSAAVGHEFVVEAWVQDYGAGNIRKEWVAKSLDTGCEVTVSQPLSLQEKLEFIQAALEAEQ